mmetsp:Transcript_12321/g.43566  ORF Transcript_12321/g.43566 Transcript_12321/m.43566 type:complete len:263 (-) Transcript_12321:470-1258(-)
MPDALHQSPSQSCEKGGGTAYWSECRFEKCQSLRYSAASFSGREAESHAATKSETFIVVRTPVRASTTGALSSEKSRRIASTSGVLSLRTSSLVARQSRQAPSTITGSFRTIASRMSASAPAAPNAQRRGKMRNTTLFRPGKSSAAVPAPALEARYAQSSACVLTAFAFTPAGSKRRRDSKYDAKTQHGTTAKDFCCASAASTMASVAPSACMPTRTPLAATACRSARPPSVSSFRSGGNVAWRTVAKASKRSERPPAAPRL